MSYTNDDIKARAIMLSGREFSAEADSMLTAICEAAAAELESKLRKGVSSETLGETFVTAAGILALAMCMELESGTEDEISAFRAGEISVNLRQNGVKASAASLRRAAEGMLSAYLESGGFSFMGVEG